MFAIIYFVRVCRDKHIKATEKIQAQMLEPFFFVVYVPMVTFVPSSFSNVYVCISQTSMQRQ